ncbi:uncharacterized protein LOC117316291 [Pecten maximus]|uniref:uncharacterized protein LOC117316291 n=1 Tax=Pecten maximus TaxID=6579 RepID=UPI001458BDFD|nr:uncharacterized protein LOC117316291 [Pecten maximus]
MKMDEEVVCSPPPVQPTSSPPEDSLLQCGFGDGTSRDLCGFSSQVRSGQQDWLHSEDIPDRQIRAGAQLPSNEYGSYMVYYDESGSATEGDSAMLISPAIVTNSNSRLVFSVHTAGNSLLSVRTNESQTENFASSLENRWLYKCMELPPNVAVSVIFTASQGADNESHIAVKDVGVELGSCPGSIQASYTNFDAPIKFDGSILVQPSILCPASCTFNKPGDCSYMSVFDPEMPSMKWEKVDLSGTTPFPQDHTTMSAIGGVYLSQQYGDTSKEYDGYSSWLVTPPINSQSVSSVEFQLIKNGHSRLTVGFIPVGELAANQTLRDALQKYNMDRSNSTVTPLLVIEASNDADMWQSYCVDLSDLQKQNGSIVFIHQGVDPMSNAYSDAYVYIDDIFMESESCQKSLDTCDWENPHSCGIRYGDDDVCPLNTDFRWQLVYLSNEHMLIADSSYGWLNDNATVYLPSNSSGQSLQFKYRFRSKENTWIGVKLGSYNYGITNLFPVDNWQHYCVHTPSEKTEWRLELQTQRGRSPSSDVAIVDIGLSDSPCPEVSANCTFESSSTCGFAMDKGWFLKKHQGQPGHYLSIHTQYSEYQYRNLLSPPVTSDSGASLCVEFLYLMKISIIDDISYIMVNLFDLAYSQSDAHGS